MARSMTNPVEMLRTSRLKVSYIRCVLVLRTYLGTCTYLTYFLKLGDPKQLLDVQVQHETMSVVRKVAHKKRGILRVPK